MRSLSHVHSVATVRTADTQASSAAVMASPRAGWPLG